MQGSYSESVSYHLEYRHRV